MDIETINNHEIFVNGVLSKGEFLKLVQILKRDGVNDEAEVEKVVVWAIKQRTGAELLNLLLEGFLAYDSWNGDEPIFGVPAAESEFPELLDFPNSEAEKC